MMASPMNEYVYDPTRRFPKIYDNDIGLILMIIGSITTVVFSIITLGMILGDHNYIAGAINGSIALFGMFLASPMIHCSDRQIKEKREVYNQYLSMNKADQNNYQSYIRTIHKDRYRKESLNYADLIKLFRSKSLSNPDSIESAQLKIKQELDNLKAMEKLNAETQAEINKINKNYDL